MSLINSVNYVDETKKIEIAQFLNKTNIKKRDDIISNKFQEIETQAMKLITEIWLDTAHGKQLDTLGILLDFPRNGLDDASYRTLLRLKVKINRSSGTPEILLETIQLVYNSTKTQYTPRFPAKVEIFQNGDLQIFITDDFQTIDGIDMITTIDGEQMIAIAAVDIGEQVISQVLPAGVGIILAEEFITIDRADLITTIDNEEISVVPGF